MKYREKFNIKLTPKEMIVIILILFILYLFLLDEITLPKNFKKKKLAFLSSICK